MPEPPDAVEQRSAGEPIVALDRIWKSFGPIEVLTDVSLSVTKGEVVCIIGPSGAGKSTLLRCINHLETIDDGTIYFEGQPVYRYKRDGKAHHRSRQAGSSRSARRSAWCSSRSTCSRI